VSGGLFDLQEFSTGEGYLTLRVTGKVSQNVTQTFQNESGGHRWQRIPPNEKRGRVHTSTVTVAVLPEPSTSGSKIDQKDLEYRTTRGCGPGGQNRNKRDNCVVLKHIPTGTTVRVDSKSQAQNRKDALRILLERLGAASRSERSSSRNNNRRTQLGSGMRGDKVRTVRCQDGIVVNHRTGTKMPLRRYLQGVLP